MPCCDILAGCAADRRQAGDDDRGQALLMTEDRLVIITIDDTQAAVLQTNRKMPMLCL